MFYGSFDQDTAVQEVTRGTRRRLAVGTFELSRTCTVIDFTRLPSVPSMFDPERGHQQRTLLFLHHFVEQMAEPVRDGYDQIDYVPTQVVAEFLLKAFNPDNPVQGLIYTSSLNQRPCAVFDLDSSCWASRRRTGMPGQRPASGSSPDPFGWSKPTADHRGPGQEELLAYDTPRQR